jgi:two-component system, NtrC family, response regulator HydG
MPTLDILVVDDDVDHAQSMGELFEIEGHRVHLAYSGEDAVAAYLARDFDLAFMDVMMPGRNGVDSFLAIRKLKPQARVYMMTGYSVEQLLQQAMEQGAMGVLMKPTDASRLLAVLDEVGPDGVVVAQKLAADTPVNMQRLLAEAGCNCRILSDTSNIENQPPHPDDGILIYDFAGPLVENIGVFTQLRQAGIVSPSIIMANDNGRRETAFTLLRDFEVTGVLNKPFDPISLLDRLQKLAL